MAIDIWEYPRVPPFRAAQGDHHRIHGSGRPHGDAGLGHALWHGARHGEAMMLTKKGSG